MRGAMHRGEIYYGGTHDTRILIARAGFTSAYHISYIIQRSSTPTATNIPRGVFQKRKSNFQNLNNWVQYFTTL